MSRSIPDRVRYLRALRTAGRSGLHTLEIRNTGLSGNPAQRAAELTERGFRVRVVREHRGGRNGARHFLEHDAGDTAAYLTDGELALREGAAFSSRAVPSRAATRPGAPARTRSASGRAVLAVSGEPETVTRERMMFYRDYCDPLGKWLKISIADYEAGRLNRQTVPEAA